MNKDRYDDLVWFDEIEAAAHKDPSREKPAPKREVKKSSLLGQLIKLLFR